tara:strand:+ start:549 stop:710 length:162 start_codon:yes stop_codon:yes gene_type:complete
MVSVYYRDKSKVMRRIPGISYLRGAIFIDESVYTYAREEFQTDSQLLFVKREK